MVVDPATTDPWEAVDASGYQTGRPALRARPHPREFREALHVLAEGTVDAAPLVTGRVGGGSTAGRPGRLG